FCRFKLEKDEGEKKQDKRFNISHGTERRSQEKPPNRSKTTDNSIIQREKRKKIVIKFKAKEIKHGKSTCTPDTVTASRKSCNKSCFDGIEGKRLWHSFAVQRNKELEKKKVELCKLKLNAEQTVLAKSKLSVHESHKKSDGSKKQSENVRFPKNPLDISTGSLHDYRPFTEKPNSLSRTWKEENEEEYKEFSKKKQHVNKHTLSLSSAETPQQLDSRKWKKQDPDSVKNTGNSGTKERDLQATALCFEQSFEIFPLPRDSQTAEADQEMQIAEDLHVARVQKKMALPVVQTCGELTSMEIDLPEQDLNVSAESCTFGLNILVVIDTNIMISHLEFIRSLKSEDIPGVGRLALIIPWVVLQELDNLKKGKMLQHVRDKAVPAVQFIYTCLKNQDPKLWGQSMQLASQKIYGLSDENNDDRVLQCCLQYQSLFPQAVVILCTDDKNLCNKAIVSEVKAFCKADLVTALQKLNVSRDHRCVGLQQSKYDTEFEKTEEGDAVLIAGFPNVLPDLEKTLGEVLSCILETEMKIAFGNLWMEVTFFILSCQEVSRTCQELVKKFKCGPFDSSTVCVLLQESKKLFHAFSTRSDYNGVLPQAFTEVNKLYQKLTE
ncbi:SWT1 protein, partial [Oreotrochilus melanogaster]|nr:SWT1 protein [Oreotrochilus melanogaster]